MTATLRPDISTVVRRSAAAALAALVPAVVCWGGPGALARTTSAGTTSADTTAGIISTVAGGVEGPALAAKAAVSPCGLQSDGNTLYVGGPALDAGLGTSVGQVRVDAAGNLVIADTDVDRVRVVAEQTGTFYGQAMKTGDIYTVAGDGSQTSSGDDGPALKAGVIPDGVAMDSAGNVVIADANCQLRVVAVRTGAFYGQAMEPGDIYTVAGGAKCGFSGDGGPATSATLGYTPSAVAVDTTGNIVVADGRNYRVRVVAASDGTFYGQAMKSGDIYTVAGDGTSDFDGNGVPAMKAALGGPTAVAADKAGNLAIADQATERIRFMAASAGRYFGQSMKQGDIYTIAGDGTESFSGDGGPARQADINLALSSAEIAFDAVGNVVFTDRQQPDPGGGRQRRHVLRPGDEDR
jgi:trimeric autotransporter adhesin